MSMYHCVGCGCVIPTAMSVNVSLGCVCVTPTAMSVNGSVKVCLCNTHSNIRVVGLDRHGQRENRVRSRRRNVPAPTEPAHNIRRARGLTSATASTAHCHDSHVVLATLESDTDSTIWCIFRATLDADCVAKKTPRAVKYLQKWGTWKSAHRPYTDVVLTCSCAPPSGWSCPRTTDSGPLRDWVHPA